MEDYLDNSNESFESNEDEVSNNEEIFHEYLQSLILTLKEGKIIIFI